jgi:hypothetical protein
MGITGNQFPTAGGICGCIAFHVAGALFVCPGFCMRRLASGASASTAASSISACHGSYFSLRCRDDNFATVEIVGTFLRDLDVLARQPHDPRIVYRFAQYIFKTFGMATREIHNIGKETVQSPKTSKKSAKEIKGGEEKS